MSGEVNRAGTQRRPSFYYRETPADGMPWAQINAELIESTRNVNEEILCELRRVRRTLDRMDRRLSRHFPITGGRG